MMPSSGESCNGRRAKDIWKRHSETRKISCFQTMKWVMAAFRHVKSRRAEAGLSGVILQVALVPD